MATVWIRITPVTSGHQLEAARRVKSLSAVDYHTNAIRHLKETHAHLQQPVLEALRQLELAQRARVRRQYWIANVIEATVALADLPGLADLSVVEHILLPPAIRLIEPEQAFIGSLLPSTDSITANLRFISAPEAWTAGYTGSGRLICSFDTGIDGEQRALKSRWKGLDGDSSAAWFDPIFCESYPHTQGEGFITRNHGTHVMGIMVGRDVGGNLTTGVAPDAHWISAAVIDVGGTAVLRAFEWAADPDGNPNTVDDVPDVINHSWGFDPVGPGSWNLQCEDIVFEAVEYTEALGIVNIFAAGNGGRYGDYSIANPAVRALDSLDCFAVGNLDATVTPLAIHETSSRGPSSCNDGIKPNVVAPGTSILSCWDSGGYGAMGGSSMAAPHVSGLVALLRQKNPGATVEEIKQAILSSAVADDSWPPLPDNSYGWGRIDCMAALNALAAPGTTAKMRVYDFDHGLIAPGDTVSGTVVVECLAAGDLDVNGVITGSHPLLTILDGSVWFGAVQYGDTVRSEDSIRVVVSGSAKSGQVLTVDFQIGGDNVQCPAKLHFVVQSPLTPEIVTHNTGLIQFSLSNFGMYGFGPGSAVPGPGAGFVFGGGSNDLWEAGLIVGISDSQVSSTVHTYVYEPDNDFTSAPGGDMQFFTPGKLVFEETRSAFNDANASDPIGIEITQESFADTDRNSDVIVLRYILTNVNPYALNGLYFGLFLDWDIVGYAQNVGGFESEAQFGWMAYYNDGNPVQFRGVKLLGGPLATVLTEKGNNLVYVPADGGNGFLASEKYEALCSGFSTADSYRSTPGELFQLMAAGPFHLNTGGIDTVTFALLAGESFDDIRDAAARAGAVITSVDNPFEKSLPRAYTLFPNYPNPFNASTVLSFDLPGQSDYELSIYNLLGQLVYKDEGRSGPGRVVIPWEARTLASGVYFYTVAARDWSATQKMILLK